jgi:hypothetical protein
MFKESVFSNLKETTWEILNLRKEIDHNLHFMSKNVLLFYIFKKTQNYYIKNFITKKDASDLIKNKNAVEDDEKVIFITKNKKNKTKSKNKFESSYLCQCNSSKDLITSLDSSLSKLGGERLYKNKKLSTIKQDKENIFISLGKEKLKNMKNIYQHENKNEERVGRKYNTIDVKDQAKLKLPTIKIENSKVIFIQNEIKQKKKPKLIRNTSMFNITRKSLDHGIYYGGGGVTKFIGVNI